MGKVCVIDHPLIQHKLTLMRDKNTCTKEFRELLDEISMLMAYEVTRDLALRPTRVETPLTMSDGAQIAVKIGVIPILRAGLGMVDGFVRLVPNAKIGHIGIYRDPETLMPVEYYCKLPTDSQEREFLVVDPMLATGASASAAITFLRERGCKSNNVKLVNLVGCPEGIKKVQKDHPDVDIFLASIDSHLNEHGYIIPGLGDAGDRIFGTK
ncbi:MAG: uracil phosphoribosyltransferase [Christensenellales bacterium]|jgi:uracil phosphoribosyltransferase